MFTTYGYYIITIFIANVNLLLIFYSSRTSILATLDPSHVFLLKWFFLNFKQISQIIFWIIKKPVFRTYFCMLSCYNLHLLHLTLCTTKHSYNFLTKWKLTIFFSLNLFWVSQRLIKASIYLRYHKKIWERLFFLWYFWRLGCKCLNIKELVYAKLKALHTWVFLENLGIGLRNANQMFIYVNQNNEVLILY